MTLSALIRQAVGSQVAQESQWESLHAPEADLLVTIAARLPEGSLSKKAQGLRRYTWVRYQLLLEQAKMVAAIQPDGVLLADDLHLAGNFYPTPAARVAHGIDFVVDKGWDRQHAERLQELGWQKPSWQDGDDCSEWYQADGTRIRFHSSWLRRAGGSMTAVLQRAEVGKHGLLALCGSDQLYRTGWQGSDPLWLVDLLIIVQREPRLRSLDWNSGLACLAGRWNALCLKGAGVSADLSSSGSWTFCQCVLAWNHRRSNRYSCLLADLAMQLTLQSRSGWPGDWLQALKKRWSLSSGAELPQALWKRWKEEPR